MRVAIPIWRGRVSPVFDAAGELLLLQVEDGAEVGRKQTQLEYAAPPPARVQLLVEEGVSVLICGAISEPIANMCLTAGISLVAWVSGPIEEVASRFLAGVLPDPDYTMPGCRGRRMRARCQRNRELNPRVDGVKHEKEQVMAQQNGTGPEGKGPGTGRGLGPCAQGKGRGRGRGRGQGRGGGRGRTGGRGQGQGAGQPRPGVTKEGN